MNAKIHQHNDAVEYLEGMRKYIRKSPSPYHASINVCNILDKHGFSRLSETDDWDLTQTKKCYVTRNGTSVIAFRLGQNSKKTHGMRLVGAHLDSPCLKLNPNPINQQSGYWMANVEVYGSPLLRTWFDRDLSIAGRIFERNTNQPVLVNCQEPIGVIPSIAIHLDRDANKCQKINSQVHVNPVLLSHAGFENSQSEPLLSQLLNANCHKTEEILGCDLRLYDVNPPRIIRSKGSSDCDPSVGYDFRKQYLSSARIDNLLSCYAGVRALVDSDDDNSCMLVLNDHEEVGSVSDSGAQGNFLQQVLERIGGLDPRVTRRSVFVSADGAHGLHPNYPEKHDDQHQPILNQGPVIKVNSNQRYASSDESESFIRKLCIESDIPVQVFVSRNNLPCGTTIGPLIAAEVGIRTVDIGVAQFAMHSIRELAGCGDAVDFIKLLKAFFSSDTSLLVN